MQTGNVTYIFSAKTIFNIFIEAEILCDLNGGWVLRSLTKSLIWHLILYSRLSSNCCDASWHDPKSDPIPGKTYQKPYRVGVCAVNVWTKIMNLQCIVPTTTTKIYIYEKNARNRYKKCSNSSNKQHRSTFHCVLWSKLQVTFQIAMHLLLYHTVLLRSTTSTLHRNAFRSNHHYFLECISHHGCICICASIWHHFAHSEHGFSTPAIRQLNEFSWKCVDCRVDIHLEPPDRDSGSETVKIHTASAAACNLFASVLPPLPSPVHP